MKVGDLVYSTFTPADPWVGLIRECTDEECVVEWLPEAKPLLPMVEKINKKYLKKVH